MGCGSSTPAAGGARPVPKKKKGAAKAGAAKAGGAPDRSKDPLSGLDLAPGCVMAEYIWIDGSMAQCRSKCKVRDPPSPGAPRAPRPSITPSRPIPPGPGRGRVLTRAASGMAGSPHLTSPPCTIPAPGGQTLYLKAGKKVELSDLPKWNFDGSSTGQAPGEDSEVILVPRAIFKDPFKAGDHILVM